MFSINLAVTTKFDINGNEDASIAMRVIPTSIQDGLVITQDDLARTLYRGSISEAVDSSELTKILALISAIKNLAE